MMFGAGDERPRAAGGQHFYPVERYGVKLISMGFFLTNKTPVIWRGPMVMGAVRQFLKAAFRSTPLSAMNVPFASFRNHDGNCR
jgi:Mrp family chromosome partitioning ATPase